MKKYLFVCFLLVGAKVCYCQKSPSWRIGINPLSLAESQMSIGPAIACRINSRVELWTEGSFIFANSYMPDRWKDMTGFRFILQPRYFLGESREWFLSPEFRFKNFSFQNRLTFINGRLTDTLRDFRFMETQTIGGGALVLGKEYVLSKKAGLLLEFTVGLGARHRFIKRRGVPAGYNYFNYGKSGSALAPAYEEDNSGTVLCPLGLRLMWSIR